MENKREKILEAGKKLILELGYAKTKVEKITEAVGIAKGSFYNYFDTKEDFLLAMISEGLEKRRKEFSSVLDKRMNYEESVRALVLHKFDTKKVAVELDMVLFSLIRNIESLTPKIRGILIETDRSEMQTIKKVLEKYRSKLDIQEDADIERYAQLINAMMKTYKGNKIYADRESEYFFTSSYEKVNEKVKKLNLEKEMHFLEKSIIRLTKGGK